MLADVVPLLRCPVCALPLSIDARALRCNASHTFDVARQGYVNLLTRPSPKSADTPAMVQARAEFLAAGHFDALADTVADAVGAGEGPLVEVGAGTGHYLARVLDRRPASVGVAVDVSVAASRRAARAHPRIGAVVADAWRVLPLADACAEAVLVVFAPRGAAELARLLPQGGRLVVATPTARHLHELVGPLGMLGIEEDKAERLCAAIAPWFVPSGTRDLEFVLRLPAEDVVRLAAMGPSAFHTDPAELRRRAEALEPPVTVGASLTVTSFDKR